MQAGLESTGEAKRCLRDFHRRPARQISGSAWQRRLHSSTASAYAACARRTSIRAAFPQARDIRRIFSARTAMRKATRLLRVTAPLQRHGARRLFPRRLWRNFPARACAAHAVIVYPKRTRRTPRRLMRRAPCKRIPAPCRRIGSRVSVRSFRNPRAGRGRLRNAWRRRHRLYAMRRGRCTTPGSSRRAPACHDS